MHRSIAWLPLLFVACASAEPQGVPAPEFEQQVLNAEQQDQRRRELAKVLLELDQAIGSYEQNLANQGTAHADQQIEKIEKFLRDTVLDTGVRNLAGSMARDAQWQPGENFRRLQAMATDGSNPWQQGIALAALGFSGRYDVMPTILQGAQLAAPQVVDRAVFGLAILRAPDTPPGVVAAVVMRADHPEEGRINAAWALYRLQTVSQRQAEFPELWRKMLAERDRMPAGVLISAIRGLGLTRDVQHAALVAPFLLHPTPQVRNATTIALARMNAQEHWRDLLRLLEPAETNQNVRLHARKALAALAGGVDYGYDLAAWRKTFDRGAASPADR